MFEAYFDPDHHAGGNNMAREQEELAKPIEDMLSAHDTGSWDYGSIDCCLTGKDADLETWGDQGLQLIAVSEEKIRVRIYLMKTYDGTDVVLNKDIDWDDYDQHSKAIDEYLEQAQEVIFGIPYDIDQSGDGWCISHEEDVEIDYIVDADGEADVEAIWESLGKAFEPIVDRWERENKMADDILNVLSGWFEWDKEKKEYVPAKEIH